ncbi:SH3 domain containing protein [Drechmeria coniospora]|uniref:SH3 domain containing protein n=1 Tax=Drechmeria coniospora TaxID=98403 RepID=A0A151GHV6_DRECN|nr:SH3 domain containing protein [Drechmeria coniospora]KYK56649.1 SH3 domain containing protein [Drechmeria coniospora]
MTRPAIIRADTIDLQDHTAPSAKDHHHPPKPASGASAVAHVAPHQAETLREIAHETAEEEARSPPITWTYPRGVGTGDDLLPHRDGSDHSSSPDPTVDSEMQHEHHEQQEDDDLALGQNGGTSSSDEGDLDGDGDGDGDLDDDMMDKISSSPSIEDGQVCTSISSVWQPPSGNAVVVVFFLVVRVPARAPTMAAVGACALNGWCTRPPATFVECQKRGLAVGSNRNPAQRSRRPQQLAENSSGPAQRLELEPDGLFHYIAHAGQDPDDPLFPVPYQPPSEDEDDGSECSLPDDPRCIEPGSVLSCLPGPGDIDFEFVYALHTFVATVEGQANATKGDTMVLLDDSNSYWWLVRVVKDSSIGYLPAEHIETPTERLARLNKHRNIDLSATMLGDQAPKQKNTNTFKGIRRRRKTVAFSEPTYVDYSDFEYSTDEEDIEELFGPSGTSQQQNDTQKPEQERDQQAAAEDEITEASPTVEPSKTWPSTEDTVRESAKQDPTLGEEEARGRGSDEMSDRKPDGVSRSRNGTVRNTDSFYKDESVETRKISLTPNLLRDDNTSRGSSESSTRELKTKASLDKLDKELVSDRDKKRIKDKEKKDKEKKPNAIRSFFSRKDKRKMSEDDDDSFGKRSMDSMAERRESDDRGTDEQTALDKPSGSAPRSPSKLQKPAPPGHSPAGAVVQKSVELSTYLAEGRTNDVSNVPPASMRIVDPGTMETQEVPSSQHQQPNRERASSTSHREEKSSPSKDKFSRKDSIPDAKSQKVIKSKTHREVDAGDGADADEAVHGNLRQADPDALLKKDRETSTRAPLPAAHQHSGQAKSATAGDIATTQESHQNAPRGTLRQPVNTSPAGRSDPPGLVVDTSSPEGHSPEASPSPDQARMVGGRQRHGSVASRESTWDDTKLRAFFDEPDHIRDLLAVVYDKTDDDDEPASSDHPIVSGLFREQNAKLAEITTVRLL